MSDILSSFEVGSGGPPVGSYIATFLGIEASDHEQWGAGAKFSAEVIDGEHAGSVSKRTAKRIPTGKNLCGKLIAGLLGVQKLEAGALLDVSPYVGKRYQILVTSNQEGTSTRLESFTRLPDEDYGDA